MHLRILCRTQIKGEFALSFNCAEAWKVYESCSLIAQTNDNFISYFQHEDPQTYRCKNNCLYVDLEVVFLKLTFVRPQGTVGCCLRLHKQERRTNMLTFEK